MKIILNPSKKYLVVNPGSNVMGEFDTYHEALSLAEHIQPNGSDWSFMGSKTPSVSGYKVNDYLKNLNGDTDEWVAIMVEE
jgi:hypothetical protein